MSASVTTSKPTTPTGPPLTQTLAPVYKPGWIRQRKTPYVLFNLPFFSPGGCGEQSLKQGMLTINTDKLDIPFWTKVAKALRRFPFLDWDWESMRKNVILPNEAHIRYHCNITDDAIWKRFCEDGYVFLNNWFELDETSEDGELIKAPNGSRVFTSMDAEY